MLRGGLSAAPLCAFTRQFTSATDVRKPHKTETALGAGNCEYLESLYSDWKTSAQSVSKGWGAIFSKLSESSPDTPLMETWESFEAAGDSPAPGSPASAAQEQKVLDHFRLAWMTRAYEKSGHRISKMKPLKLHDGHMPEELKLAHFGFNDEDVHREFEQTSIPSLGGMHAKQAKLTLQKITERLHEIYCGKAGYEFLHIADSKQSKWIRDRIHAQATPGADVRQKCYAELVKTFSFQQLVSAEYSNVKRHGLSGAETLIPMLNRLIDKAAESGIKEIIFGVTHRGILSILPFSMGYDVGTMLSNLRSIFVDADEQRSEVAYQTKNIMKGTRTVASGKTVDITVLASGTQQESISSIAVGYTRGRQHATRDTQRHERLAVLLHGDGGFMTQGICYETIGLSDLEFYEVGGTVHIIINNEVGNSGPVLQTQREGYCSDLGKPVQAPIFHVNGDEPDQALNIVDLCVDYRAAFHQDTVIDLVCYRRLGHSNLEDPTLSDPFRYNIIKSHPNVLELYAKTLQRAGLLTQKAHEEALSTEAKALRAVHERVSKGQYSPRYDMEWTNIPEPSGKPSVQATCVPADKLLALGKALTTLPSDFQPHPTIKRILGERQKSYIAGKNIDWGGAEALAFASLLSDGVHVRVSGQDVERGTFSHRHALVVDMQTTAAHIPLRTVSPGQAPFRIINSSLSEYGVCGYELGYALSNRDAVVIWEAQFGDFANGAQVIFDQYLSSLEARWAAQAALVINLPHGYDGMGPEHSSGRIERFLQGANEGDAAPAYIMKKTEASADELLAQAMERCNWQVCFPTTPANYFHLLRRQVARAFRKPLINFYSKAFLRAPNLSAMRDLSETQCFQPVISDTVVKPAKVKKVVLCTGQVYFHLAKHRGLDESRSSVALVRVEQLSPFPWAHLHEALSKFPADAQIAWAQEEPKNMGAWAHVRTRLRNYLRKVGRRQDVQFVGRPQCASPATGNKAIHDHEIAVILRESFAV